MRHFLSGNFHAGSCAYGKHDFHIWRQKSCESICKWNGGKDFADADRVYPDPVMVRVKSGWDFQPCENLAETPARPPQANVIERESDDSCDNVGYIKE